MSTTYTSTIEVNVWKEHTCLHCGTVYRYLFKRSKQGQGATPDAASAAAHNAVVSALALCFECIPLLSGRLGEVAYFFVWMVMIAMGAMSEGGGAGLFVDILGIGLISHRVPSD